MPWPCTLEHTALLAALRVCLFVCVCLNVDRSDTSFICFELSVDYLCAVRSYSVLAGTDWKVGVAVGRWEEREIVQREAGGFLLPHQR